MKKTYLALASITGLLVAGNAYGEDEVYYCAMTDSNGFGYDKSVAHINVLDLHHKDLK